MLHQLWYLAKQFYQTHTYYILGIGIVVTGIVSGFIVVSFLGRLLDDVTVTPENKIRNRALVAKIHFPINVVFLILSIYAVHRLGGFPNELESYLLIGMKAIFDAAIFMVLYHFAGAFILVKLFHGIGLNVSDSIRHLLSDFIKSLIAILGIVTVLDNFNINVGPMLGGLAVLGSAIAFASKESLEGFIGSLTVVLEGKFKEGDVIQFKDLKGIVEDVGIRSTTIRGVDHTLTVIPNKELTEGVITNFSKMNWSVDFNFSLPYERTQAELEKTILTYRNWLMMNPDIESDPEKGLIIVRLNGFTDRGFNIFVLFYTKTNDWVEYLRVREASMLKLIKITEEENAIFDATQNIMLYHGDTEKLSIQSNFSKKTKVSSFAKQTKKTSSVKENEGSNV